MLAFVNSENFLKLYFGVKCWFGVALDVNSLDWCVLHSFVIGWLEFKGGSKGGRRKSSKVSTWCLLPHHTTILIASRNPKAKLFYKGKLAQRGKRGHIDPAWMAGWEVIFILSLLLSMWTACMAPELTCSFELIIYPFTQTHASQRFLNI